MNTLLFVPFLLVQSTFSLGLSLQVAAANPVADIIQALRAKDYSAAIARADAALKLHPEDPRLWTLKGMARSAQDPQHPADSLRDFQHALRIAPAYLPALEAAAQGEYLLGDPAARGHLEGVLAAQPANPAANGMLAVLDFRAGNYAAAAQHFHAAEPLIDTQPQPLAQYAVSLAGSGQLEAALPVFQKLVELQPDDARALYNLALVEHQLRHDEEALTHLNSLLSVPKPEIDVLTLAAEVYEAKGETQQSLDVLRRAMQLYPAQPDGYLYMAHMAFAHSSVQVGIDVLNAGLRQLPNDSRLYVARGVLLAQLGKNEEAAADFDRAGELDPKLAATRAAKGVAESQQHLDRNALSTFRDAAARQPDDPLTQYLLAEAISNTNPASDSADGKEELAALTRAVSLDPKMADAQDLLATIYMRQGDFVRAAEHSQAALAIRPNDQQALFHLVLAARKGVHKDQLPALVERLANARNASPDPLEAPRGYLVEAR